ncbi:MAG TPA: phosphoribosylformylglycinamidine synthase subunit PurQ, partial [Dehalococcoidia bacterium]|nr:phosphoribosylformylglycinamidine synthase subunit PurQ [Dehalococcoidia bacterium]
GAPKLKFGIVVFPGTWSEKDTHHAVNGVLDQDAEYIWHGDEALDQYDAIVLPGGFSYGDFLRCGAIARFSPVMEAVRNFADRGGPVLGICNGFQVLCESGLLPGVLMRNDHLEFRCIWTDLRVENDLTMFTSTATKGQTLHIPMSHGEGNYQADDATIERLESNWQVVLRYADAAGNVTPEINPNGSINNIAGIINERGNVMGMMPHPEKASEKLIGGDDGNVIFSSMIENLVATLT